MDQTSAATATTTEAADKASDPSGSPSEGGSLADVKTDQGDKPAEGAPEAYADFKLPEGVELKGEFIDEFKGVAKGLGLTQDGAQSLLDLHVKAIKDVTEASLNAVAELRKSWRDQVLANSDLAHNGDLRTEVKATLGRFIDSFGPKIAADFREAMNFTGAGDHPGFIAFFHAAAKAMGEGRPAQGANPAPTGQQNPAKPNGIGPQALYPNLPSGQS